MQIKKVALFLILVPMTGSTAYASLAEAEITNFQLVLTGPGLGFLSDGPNSGGFVLRDGNANTAHFTDANIWPSPFYTDNLGFTISDRGALSSVGSMIIATPDGINIVMTADHILARASGESDHAEAILDANMFLDIVGIPPAGSTITVTSVIGDTNLLELYSPRASANLFGEVRAMKYVDGDPVLFGGVADGQNQMMGDDLTLNPFTIDLSDHVVDSFISFHILLSASATVSPTPASSSLAVLGLGLIACRRRR